MSRRLFGLPAALAAAAILVAAAPAALVHVRVEGRNATIFGSTEPRASGATPLQTLESASIAGEFYYHLATSSFGSYVDQIGRYAADASNGWVFKVNGALPPVGADKVALRDGDTVLWYWATFSSSGAGPATLRIALAGRGCYAVTAQDDQGKPVSPAGAFLQLDGRVVKVAGAKTCPGPHRGLVKAVHFGFVRSNSLP